MKIALTVLEKTKSGTFDNIIKALCDIGLDVDKMELAQAVINQHQKGVAKYGKALDESTGLNYKNEAVQELADLLMYIERENNERHG